MVWREEDGGDRRKDEVVGCREDERKGKTGWLGEERLKGGSEILRVVWRLSDIDILQLVLLNYINALQAQR